MLVASIIILAVALAVPSVQGMARSNRHAQTVNTLNGLVTLAQVAAKSNGADAGIRIERAFRVDNATGLMLKNDRAAPWLDHQQARIVESATGRTYVFHHDPNSRVYPLPADTWLAPGYCLDWTADNLADNSSRFNHSPQDPKAAVYSAFDTFYIVFDSKGELTIRGRADNWYIDRTQRWYNSTKNEHVDPLVDHPDNSARSVLVYDRREWQAINPLHGAARLAFLQQKARAIHFNRITGAVVEASP